MDDDLFVRVPEEAELPPENNDERVDGDGARDPGSVGGGGGNDGTRAPDRDENDPPASRENGRPARVSRRAPRYGDE